MKKANLSFMAVMIISLVIILIINTMAVFAYRDEITSIETRKDNMLSFNIKYSTLREALYSKAKQYLQTNDEKFKSEFYSLLNNYKKNDNISLGYRIFTEEQATKSLKEILTSADFTISSQAEFIQFNEKEERLYVSFLNSFDTLEGILTNAVDTRDSSNIMSAGFDGAYEEQTEIMSSLTKSYIERLNQKADSILQLLILLEYTMIAVSLLLLCFATATFLLILKENAFNSYFRKLYNTVVENIDGGIAILDKDYRFEYTNYKYKEIMGIAAIDPTGKTIPETFDQRITQIIEDATMQNPSGEGKVDVLIGSKRKNIIYTYFTIDDERRNDKYVHLIRDNTKTEELQIQLRKQLKEINFYSQAKDSFIANISHEIKTPINAILGMVHFLKSTRLSQNQKELVRKIETSSDILLTIISDVLDLSKIKNNSLSLYPTDFSLAQVIKNVEDMFSNQLAFKGIGWRTEYEFNRDLCLHLDKTRFVQVLVNLINNASKFTDTGYVKLSVETLSENEEMVLLRFCVEDTGIGIAEKDISKLFREFEQLENHLTKQHQGTGLGLYICKNIIESMNGRMWVKSNKGQGSQFYFSIPAQKALEQKFSEDSNAAAAIPLDGCGRKALVVEDTDINAEVAVKLLNDVNITCDTAADGASAVELCRNKPAGYYNVILMDIHMPNMDGYTAASILKNELSVTSPIVALTASDINDQIRAEHSDTIENFLLKPFKAAAFYKAIAPFFPNQTDGGNRDGHSRQKPTNEERRDPFAGREDAIKNLGGLESIYYKHIEKFKVNYSNSAEHIAALLEEKNYDEARRLAHSIKGLGGTLGMLDVMESSAELEKAILKGECYDLSVELENFHHELKTAIDAI